jgi:hypothetical protein
MIPPIGAGGKPLGVVIDRGITAMPFGELARSRKFGRGAVDVCYAPNSGAEADIAGCLGWASAAARNARATLGLLRRSVADYAR